MSIARLVLLVFFLVVLLVVLVTDGDSESSRPSACTSGGEEENIESLDRGGQRQQRRTEDHGGQDGEPQGDDARRIEAFVHAVAQLIAVAVQAMSTLARCRKPLWWAQKSMARCTC